MTNIDPEKTKIEFTIKNFVLLIIALIGVVFSIAYNIGYYKKSFEEVETLNNRVDGQTQNQNKMDEKLDRIVNLLGPKQ